MSAKQKTWVPFWWESNQTWGRIDSPEDWEKVVATYPDGSLGTAQEAEEGHGRDVAKIPKFGFRIECNGDLTLKDWADANQMTLKCVNDT